MYNQPYFIPGYYSTMAPSMMRGVGNTLARGSAARGGGLLSRLGSGISSLRSLNWSGLINNTSKTLNVVNQAIPLVRQVGPMYNNMKSMFKVASVFKDETNRPRRNKTNNSNNYYHNNNYANTNFYSQKQTTNNTSPSRNSQIIKENEGIEEVSNSSADVDNSPIFFIA